MQREAGMSLVPRAVILAAVMLLTFATSFSSRAQVEPAKAATARSTEEIKSVLDDNKGRLFATYNRFRKDNPTLSGKIVLELHIAPSGVVTECLVVANETKSEALQEALANEVRKLDFGARDVAPMVAKFPIEFLP